MTADLAGTLAAAAVSVGAQATETGGAIEWSAGGIVFARLDGPAAEFRLAPEVAAAARRTPDTAASPRGHDWVAFRPASLDGHATDRAAAWFASACRRATGG